MPEEYVVLIHGTYANAEEDQGNRWWQRESDFWNSLRKKLPKKISLLDTSSLFHWSGENDALERHVAGETLYRYLLDLESKGIAYHVVAHSHGGSVLWSALRSAELAAQHNRGNSLIGPKSCIAIGSPFLIYHQSRLTKSTLWLMEAAALLLQIGIPIGVCYALWSQLGYLSLFSIFLAIFTFPMVEMRTFPIKFASMQRYDPIIARKYNDRWLSIWSHDDEAINTLRSAIRLKNTRLIFKPSQPIVPPHAANWVLKIIFSGHTVAILLFDKFVVPTLTRLVRRRIAASTLGVRFTSRIQKVEPWPCDDLKDQQSLPEAIQKELIVEADRHLANAAPSVRLALRSLGNGEVANPLRFLKDSKLEELVHTSYFNNAKIVDLVIDHIVSHSSTDKN